MSSDLTFITNEAGKTLRDRFGVLLSQDTRFFDCLVGYFFISGFYKLYPALETVGRIRILVGLKHIGLPMNFCKERRNKMSLVSSLMQKPRIKYPLECFRNLRSLRIARRLRLASTSSSSGCAQENLRSKPTPRKTFTRKSTS